MNLIDPRKIIKHFYPEDTDLYRMLIFHSEQVRGKALAILMNSGLKLDWQLVTNGAMLHDIGIIQCHAPGIFCDGSESYIAHGVIGAQMLREYATKQGINLEPYARICERHTGSGLTAADVRNQALPIAECDYLPETPEEKLICLADKFFSKSGNMREKSLDRIRYALSKFGTEAVARFDEMYNMFNTQYAIR